MLRLLADENFDNDIVRGLLHVHPKLDLVRVQDIGLAGGKDPVVLERAAQQQRVLLTHDLRTVPKYAYAQVAAGQPMPGVFAVPRSVPVGRAIEDIALLVECSVDGEWEGQIRYLPL